MKILKISLFLAAILKGKNCVMKILIFVVGSAECKMRIYIVKNIMRWHHRQRYFHIFFLLFWDFTRFHYIFSSFMLFLSFHSTSSEYSRSLVMLFGNVHDDDDDDDSEWGGITVVWFLYRKLMGGGGSFWNLRLDFIKIKISERFHENYKLNIWLENSNIQWHVILRFSSHQSTYFDTFCQRNEKKILECELKTKKKLFLLWIEIVLSISKRNECSDSVCVCVHVKEGHYVKTYIQFTRQPYTFFFLLTNFASEHRCSYFIKFQLTYSATLKFFVCRVCQSPSLLSTLTRSSLALLKNL